MSRIWLPSSNISRQSHPSHWRSAISAVLCTALLFLFPTWTRSAEPAGPPIRFGVTPAIVHDQYGVLDDWRIYLERKLERKVEFVSRDSYRETIDLISQKKLDFAWVSTLPYVYLNRRHYASLLATPLYRGRP